LNELHRREYRNYCIQYDFHKLIVDVFFEFGGSLGNRRGIDKAVAQPIYAGGILGAVAKLGTIGQVEFVFEIPARPTNGRTRPSFEKLFS
jgi:hypothetical protein